MQINSIPGLLSILCSLKYFVSACGNQFFVAMTKYVSKQLKGEKIYFYFGLASEFSAHRWTENMV
jgi:hypothetical protein